jgi:hypothetical protein
MFGKAIKKSVSTGSAEQFKIHVMISKDKIYLWVLMKEFTVITM